MPICTFEKISIVDHGATEKMGKIIFADGIKATIHIDSKSNVCFEFLSKKETESMQNFISRVHPEIKANYRNELESWIDGHSEHVDGTRIDTMPWLSPSQVENMKSAGVNTVEKLAKESDSTLVPLGLNGAVLRRQAQAWLDEQGGKSMKAVADLQSENEALRARLEMLEERLTDPQSEEPTKRGPGRQKA